MKNNSISGFTSTIRNITSSIPHTSSIILQKSTDNSQKFYVTSPHLIKSSQLSTKNHVISTTKIQEEMSTTAPKLLITSNCSTVTSNSISPERIPSQSTIKVRQNKSTTATTTRDPFFLIPLEEFVF